MVVDSLYLYSYISMITFWVFANYYNNAFEVLMSSSRERKRPKKANPGISTYSLYGYTICYFLCSYIKLWKIKYFKLAVPA